MGAKALKPAIQNLYDEDFAIWTEETARLLRAGRFDHIDVEHLAEEVEDMGKSQGHEVRSRLRVLMVHLLKWKCQPQKRSRSWSSTAATQRAELRDVFSESPSLRAKLPPSIPDVYPDAVEQAALETGLPESAFPRECPFSPEQIMDRRFLPD